MRRYLKTSNEHMRKVPIHYKRLFASNDDFRAAFDEMHDAVEDLPDSVITEGRELPYPQLHHACLTDNLSLVGALLDNGLSVDMYPCTEDEDDLTPLGWLAREEEMVIAEKVEMAELLLARGADPEEGDPLEQAQMIEDLQFESFLKNAIATYER
jgi:hypothetical protein